LPVDDFWVVSHGSNVGVMVLPLGDGLTGGSFEEVETAATNGTIAIPSDVRDPRTIGTGGVPIPCVVHIVGCFVGRHDAYMRRLRKAMGDEGAFGVEAPNKWDAFYVHKDAKAIFKGALRYMLYDFRIGSIDPIATRKDLLDALRAKGYQRIDGSVVPDAVFESGVPARDFDVIGRVQPKFSVALKPAIEGRKSIPVTGVYDHSKQKVGPFPVQLGPANNSPRLERETFIEAELKTFPAFDPTHPLPYHTRLDFASLSDFVKGYDWLREPTLPDEFGRSNWSGFRDLYMCGIPVVDPANDKQELMHDFLSSDGSIQRLTLSNNPNFFARVFTS